jgi:DUF438 domain-containing protein
MDHSGIKFACIFHHYPAALEFVQKRVMFNFFSDFQAIFQYFHKKVQVTRSRAVR